MISQSSEAQPLIVVGVDSSPNAAVVLDAAVVMAERTGSKLVLVGAVEGGEWRIFLPAELAVWGESSLWAELEKNAHATLAKAEERLRPGLVVARHVAQGAAATVLLDAASKYAARLMVIGAHTYRPTERMLGTTAAKVANRAPCSVLIVRRAAGQAAAVGFERIAVALDGSERARLVLDAALGLAAPSAGRLTLIRAVVPPDEVTASVWGKRPEEILSMFTDNGKAALEAIRASLPGQVPAESVARVGAPHEVVLGVAADKDATLIVLGSHGFDVLDRLIGTTAGRVANAADRSVLIVRGG